MRTTSGTLVVSISLGLPLCLMSCRQDNQLRRNDTVHIEQTPPVSPRRQERASSSWEPRLGTFFAIRARNGLSALLVLPTYPSDALLDTTVFDLQLTEGSVLQLLHGGRRVAMARVSSATLDREEDCPGWPSATLLAIPGSGSSEAWTIGIDSAVTPLVMDSLSALTARDSTNLTIALARLASALPGDTAATFRGRPFVVRQAFRFTQGESNLVFAEVVRSVSQEATPLQEHLLMIAQVDTVERSRHTVQYFERSISVEDAAEATELLAVVQVGQSELFAIFSRDLGNGVRYSLIERTTDGEWRMRWTSPYAGC